MKKLTDDVSKFLNDASNYECAVEIISFLSGDLNLYDFFSNLGK